VHLQINKLGLARNEILSLINLYIVSASGLGVGFHDNIAADVD